MKFILQPWQLMLIILASWVNRQQQEVIEYLRTENAVLKAKFGKQRILLTDDQRRRLAVKGKLLGRKQLQQVGTLFTPDTILRWHRQLVANKWDYSNRKEKKSGRPRTRQVIVDLTVKFAKENPTWGYERISGALSNVGRLSDMRELDLSITKITDEGLQHLHGLTELSDLWFMNTDVTEAGVATLRQSLPNCKVHR